MDDEEYDYAKRIGIPKGHTLRTVESKRELRKGQDADIYVLEELDAAGNLVGNYEVIDSMSTYPPFPRSVSHRKVG